MTFPILQSGSLELNDVLSFEQRWNLLIFLHACRCLSRCLRFGIFFLAVILSEKKGFGFDWGFQPRSCLEIISGLRAMMFSKPSFLFPLVVSEKPREIGLSALRAAGSGAQKLIAWVASVGCVIEGAIKLRL